VTLTNQAVACKSDPAPVTGHVKTVEILVDRTSIETFVNEGEVSLSACFLPAGVLKVLGVSEQVIDSPLWQEDNLGTF